MSVQQLGTLVGRRRIHTNLGMSIKYYSDACVCILTCFITISHVFRDSSETRMAQPSTNNKSSQEEDKPAIATFVFLDLESTGLGGDGKQPRITELCLVAVHRDNLQDPCKDDTPRVLNKLTLCTYPMKVVEHGAAQITGEMLCHFSNSGCHIQAN